MFSNPLTLPLLGDKCGAGVPLLRWKGKRRKGRATEQFVPFTDTAHGMLHVSLPLQPSLGKGKDGKGKDGKGKGKSKGKGRLCRFGFMKAPTNLRVMASNLLAMASNLIIY